MNWYKNNFLPPSQPFFTGSVLQSPESGIWTAEIITSSTPILQTVITQSVTIRTNLIYIESQFGTGSCTSLTLDENASNLVQMNLYDFYQWKKNGVSIPGANSYTYSASTTGVYTCVASLSCGTGTSNPLSITIENPPTQKTITASGAFPVPHPTKPADLEFGSTQNMWDRRTKYGQARWDLLEFCISELEKELNNGQP